jgi:hypothetical protein
MTIVKSYYTLPPAIEGTLPEWFRYPKNPSRAHPLCPCRPSGVKPLPLSQNRQTRHLRPRSSPRRIATDRPLGVATIARKSVGDEVGWLRSWFSRETQGLRLPTEVSTSEGISDSMPAGSWRPTALHQILGQHEGQESPEASERNQDQRSHLQPQPVGTFPHRIDHKLNMLIERHAQLLRSLKDILTVHIAGKRLVLQLFLDR